ncbi:uncharacterized protein L201_005993 [Kwoniella dendrophila CBS 6074]|uniref:Uncharacterized protein n=1 Tax=Kwoniella dendrophila CBS 6074 TaxID=1295534 RepID=A0AAX4K0B7_9TREE
MSSLIVMSNTTTSTPVNCTFSYLPSATYLCGKENSTISFSRLGPTCLIPYESVQAIQYDNVTTPCHNHSQPQSIRCPGVPLKATKSGTNKEVEYLSKSTFKVIGVVALILSLSLHSLL